MRKFMIAAGVATLLCAGSMAMAEPAQVNYESMLEILVDSGDLDRLDLVDILIAEVRTAQIIWEMMRQECISKRL